KGIAFLKFTNPGSPIVVAQVRPLASRLPHRLHQQSPRLLGVPRIKGGDVPESCALFEILNELQVEHRSAICISVHADPALVRIVQSELREVAMDIAGMRQQTVEDDVEMLN